jgi:hypothetical protein
MKAIPSHLLTLLLILGAAQRAAAASPLQTMQEALQFRHELATAVGAGQTPPAAALAQLRTRKDASGLALAPEADLALAALDLGHRLLALHQPAPAEVFFRAAEEALTHHLRARALTAPEKAQYLRHLAWVRGHYLNQIDQAKADIDEAIQLQPQDRSLPELRGQLARGQGEHFKEPRKG